MKLAACVLIERSDGKILCVSRFDDLKNWNLPGGKREPNESAVMNAIRELEEETGVMAYPYGMKLIHSGSCDGEFFVDTYSANFNDCLGMDRLRSSAEGSVAWKDWADLLSENSSFRVYNAELFAKVASA